MECFSAVLQHFSTELPDKFSLIISTNKEVWGCHCGTWVCYSMLHALSEALRVVRRSCVCCVELRELCQLHLVS